MNTFLVNQNNNAQRRTLTADEDELLFVTGKDIIMLFLLRHFLAQNQAGVKQ